MKKIALALSIVLIFTLLAVPFSFSAVAASAPSASLSAPSELRAGDTVKISFVINGEDVYGMECKYAFDDSQFSVSVDPKTSLSGWKLEHNAATILVTDDTQQNPINGKKTVFTVTFKAKSDLEAGEVAKITFKDIKITVKDASAIGGFRESSHGNIAFEKTVATPKSNNANLKSLSVAGYDFTSSFSASNKAYTLKEVVPYAVSKLTVSAATDDPNAKYSVSGTTLSEGNNTIRVTVTAENGTTKKTYTISCTRQKNPDYQSSTDATLSELIPSAGVLSPAFDTEITSYIVYVPFEQTVFSMTATPTDSKAAVGALEEMPLEVGPNTYTVSVTAESGDVATYTVCVYRLPLFEGTPPVISNPEDAPPTTDEPNEDQPNENEPNEDKPGQETTPQEPETIIKTEYVTEKVGVPFYLVASLGVIGIGIGFTLAIAFIDKKS